METASVTVIQQRYHIADLLAGFLMYTTIAALHFYSFLPIIPPCPFVIGYPVSSLRCDHACSSIHHDSCLWFLHFPLKVFGFGILLRSKTSQPPSHFDILHSHAKRHPALNELSFYSLENTELPGCLCQTFQVILQVRLHYGLNCNQAEYSISSCITR